MKALVFLIDGKRQSNRNWGLDVCMFLFNLIGSANYFNLMTYTRTPEELKVSVSANLVDERRHEQLQKGNIAEIGSASC